VAIINLEGRVFMSAIECPFRTVDRLLESLSPEVKVILVDIHAEATSEKQAMGWHLDGRVSAVVGTHTHVQTADERILPGGTGYISDAGMTGPVDSVIGMKREIILERFLTQRPQPLQSGHPEYATPGRGAENRRPGPLPGSPPGTTAAEIGLKFFSVHPTGCFLSLSKLLRKVANCQWLVIREKCRVGTAHHLHEPVPKDNSGTKKYLKRNPAAVNRPGPPHRPRPRD